MTPRAPLPVAGAGRGKGTESGDVVASQTTPSSRAATESGSELDARPVRGRLLLSTLYYRLSRGACRERQKGVAHTRGQSGAERSDGSPATPEPADGPHREGRAAHRVLPGSG